ncbi:hypothetical protein [Anaerosphaera multitolerans]|uniref:hypothetical protein n=1 Tax=Anaerosphaera multitolerans TaxID=2487351 RepID=UPI0013E3556D|nr:hypothetical protein [Anaerosphaera multitolerans]
MSGKKYDEEIDEVFVQLLKGLVAFFIVMLVTDIILLGLLAFVIGATGIPEIKKK